MVIKDEFGAILDRDAEWWRHHGRVWIGAYGRHSYAELSDKASKFAADMLSSASGNLREEAESWRCAYQKLYEANSVATNRSEQLVRENIRLASEVRLLKAAVYIMVAAVAVMLICLRSAGGNPW